MAIRKILIILGALLFLFACEETTEWELNPADNGQLVVEAILTDENIQQKVRLSQSYDQLNGTVEPVTDANVWVEVQGLTFQFANDQSEPGLYLSQTQFFVLNNLDYQLHIDWQGQQYAASSELSDVAPIPAITFNRTREDSLTLGDFIPLYNANQQAMYEMNIDWSHLSNNGLSKAKMFFYTFSNLDISEFVRPPRDTVYFPSGSIVVAKKFGLNDDFADYLRALAIETEWRGSFFYGASSSLPTNISNGAHGFFSTCAVITETIVAR